MIRLGARYSYNFIKSNHVAPIQRVSLLKGRKNSSNKFSMSTNTDSLWGDILAKHDKALASSDLIYYSAETEEAYSDQQEKIKYQIRFVPALNKKPTGAEKTRNPISPKEHRSPPKFNPFLPCDPALTISDSILPEHNIVLNKFCVIPGHTLLTTKEFQPQAEPLTLSDFNALCTFFKKASPANLLGFFNCGEKSGASQPHKHVQLIPISKNEPPISDFLIKSLENKPFDQSLELEELPYLHRVARLSSLEDPNLIHQIYQAMLSEIGDLSLHHNLVLFPGVLYLLPRSKENFEYNGEVFSINSLGAIHMVLAKSPEQKMCLMDILKNDHAIDAAKSDPHPLQWVGQWVGWPKKSHL